MIEALRTAISRAHTADASYWRSKIRLRVKALEEDEPVFGLVPSEVAELAALKEALKLR